MTLNFHTNKKILQEVAIILSKRLWNKIAGFSTHLMEQIQKGPVQGISLKLQEKCEQRMDFVAEESATKADTIEVNRCNHQFIIKICSFLRFGSSIPLGDLRLPFGAGMENPKKISVGGQGGFGDRWRVRGSESGL